jgi:hypothetical protein
LHSFQEGSLLRFLQAMEDEKEKGRVANGLFLLKLHALHSMCAPATVRFHKDRVVSAPAGTNRGDR